MTTANETVFSAIIATQAVPSRVGSASYWADCLAQRAGTSPTRLGSIYPDLTVEELNTVLEKLEWSPYLHDAISSPAIGYRAEFGGEVGVERIDALPAGTTLVLDDGKGTGKLTPIARGLPRAPVGFTTMLLGPSSNGDLMVWTFFPGDPIRESTLTADNEFGLKHGSEISLAQANELGLVFVKVGE